jgi:hypothetical protein
MSNRQNGGVIIIGVEEVGGKLAPTGMDSGHLSTWNYDDLADKIAKYADPYVSLSLSIESDNNRNFAIIKVDEFDEIPVLCKSQYEDANNRVILRKGALYVRSRGKPATTEVAGQTEMREVLALAAGKGIRAFLSTARRGGLDPDELHVKSSEDMYAEQRSDWDE